MLRRLRVPWTAVLVVYIVAHTMCITNLAYATKMNYIHWNTSNPLFRIDNTDHIIDVNKGNTQFEYDQVNIICPVYSRDTKEDDTEKYIIYNVSKEEYDTCRITNPSPRIIAVCDQPYKLMYFTITFRSFTPQPGGLEFRPGQDYYFISTSSKDDLYRRIGGRCTTHNMKVVFKVCCDPASQPAHDQANGHLPSKGISMAPRDSSSTIASTTKSSSLATTQESSSPSTTSTTTTSTTTIILKSTSPRKSTDIFSKSSGPKVAADTKKVSKNKTEAVELTRSNSGNSYASKSWLLSIPFRICLCLSLWLTVGYHL